MNAPRKLILVVDDDRFFREILEHALQAAGYDVDTASSGEDALEYVKICWPDAITTDYNMVGGMNGAELLRELSKLDTPTQAKLPTFFFSDGLDKVSDEEKALATNAFGKGEIPELIAAVAEALG